MAKNSTFFTVISETSCRESVGISEQPPAERFGRTASTTRKSAQIDVISFCIGARQCVEGRWSTGDWNSRRGRTPDGFPPIATFCCRFGRCLLGAVSAPPGVASGTGLRANYKAGIPLRARTRLHRPKRSYASCDSSACVSTISGISGVGEKPSSAGARTAWASAGRPVDW
jgi:hypothetical protein